VCVAGHADGGVDTDDGLSGDRFYVAEEGKGVVLESR
jgi:hypothetical protein